MIEKIENGYTLFMKKNEQELIGTLTLKDDNIYKDIIELNKGDMLFINEFPNIYNKIDENNALSIIYDKEKNRFVSSINEKINIGEYNDKMIWNDTLNNSGHDIFESLNHLNDHIEDNIERSLTI